MAVSLDASRRTDRWEELLDKLVDYLGLISGVIIVSDPRHERRVTPFQSRFIREDARDMLQRFLAREDADDAPAYRAIQNLPLRSEEHTSELQSLMRISYAVFCLKKKKNKNKKR